MLNSQKKLTLTAYILSFHSISHRPHGGTRTVCRLAIPFISSNLKLRLLRVSAFPVYYPILLSPTVSVNVISRMDALIPHTSNSIFLNTFRFFLRAIPEFLRIPYTPSYFYSNPFYFPLSLDHLLSQVLMLQLNDFVRANFTQ
jgi:hypothetical protein